MNPRDAHHTFRIEGRRQRLHSGAILHTGLDSFRETSGDNLSRLLRAGVGFRIMALQYYLNFHVKLIADRRCRHFRTGSKMRTVLAFFRQMRNVLNHIRLGHFQSVSLMSRLRSGFPSRLFPVTDRTRLAIPIRRGRFGTVLRVFAQTLFQFFDSR